MHCVEECSPSPSNRYGLREWKSSWANHSLTSESNTIRPQCFSHEQILKGRKGRGNFWLKRPRKKL